ncbi:MAG: ACR3 family arsenite efflux transporter [Methanomassiliicoccales archaeon]|nr:MAG: ACR3 family arsenite efflux transporter [Methanomassiliicoccales archaeon]
MAKEKTLGFFERYLTLWVAICIMLGIGLGRAFPKISDVLNRIQYANVSIPIAVCLFFMIYPIMVQIDFKRVIEAGKTPKPVALTLIVNWGIKPFTMAFFAWLFMRIIWAPFISSDLASEYTAGMILLGVAPCTAMVLVWSYLSKGNMGHTLVMVAINSLTMLFLYAPLGGFLLGVASIPVPWETIAFSVGVYVGVPLVLGYFSRKEILKRKDLDWFENHFSPNLKYISIVALLITLIVLFSLQGDVIFQQPAIIGMIALPLFIQTMFIFSIAYGLSIKMKLKYEDAAPTSQIGASNHFEVAIAVAIMLFGLDSGAALATVVGVLIEVPVMLALVKICLSTKHWFK